MEQKNIVAFVVVLGLIIVGMFVFTYLKKTEMSEVKPTPTQVVVPEKTSPYSSITRIDAKHFFSNGIHTIVGEIPMPTPCDLLNWSTSTQETNPVQETINFTVINHAETCAQTVTPQRFMTSFPAPSNVVIKATLQGRSIDVNLIPAQAGETPENFELFLKG